MRHHGPGRGATNVGPKPGNVRRDGPAWGLGFEWQAGNYEMDALLARTLLRHLSTKNHKDPSKDCTIMTQRVYLPADARARSQMLAAHMKESARKVNGDSASGHNERQEKTSAGTDRTPK